MATKLHRLKGEMQFDNAGKPLAGGFLHYFEAGTDVEQTTYSDAAGTVPNANPVPLDGYGRLTESVYFGDLGDFVNYKELLTTGAGVTIPPWPVDDLAAAPADVVQANSAALELNWIQITAANSPVALTAADAGKAYECDTAAGNIEFDFPPANEWTDQTFWFKKTAAANTLTLDPSGTQSIDGNSASVVISDKDAAFGVSSNGAALYIVTATPSGDSLYRAVGSMVEETSVDTEADFLIMGDTSATRGRKVKPKNVPGRIVQRFYASSSSFSTTTILPADGTIPQITEGGQLFSQAITPKSTTNRIRIRCQATLVSNFSDPAILSLAVFVAGTNNALTACGDIQTDNGQPINLSIEYEQAAGATTELTFSVRAGCNSSGTTSIASSYGAIPAASFVIEEIVP